METPNSRLLEPHAVFSPNTVDAAQHLVAMGGTPAIAVELLPSASPTVALPVIPEEDEDGDDTLSLQPEAKRLKLEHRRRLPQPHCLILPPRVVSDRDEQGVEGHEHEDEDEDEDEQEEDADRSASAAADGYQGEAEEDEDDDGSEDDSFAAGFSLGRRSSFNCSSGDGADDDNGDDNDGTGDCSVYSLSPLSSDAWQHGQQRPRQRLGGWSHSPMSDSDGIGGIGEETVPPKPSAFEMEMLRSRPLPSGVVISLNSTGSTVGFSLHTRHPVFVPPTDHLPSRRLLLY